jgi:hypothetical protein
LIVNGKMVTATGGSPDTASVTISLVDAQGRFTGGFDATDDREVVGLVRVPVGNDGTWTVDLTPTSLITSPAGGVLYRVDERVQLGASATYYISVPASGGPYWVGDIQVPLPGTPDRPALYLPLAGGEMTGVLVLDDGSPAASEQWVMDNGGGGGGGGGTPSGTVVAETSYGQAATAGAASAYSRGDHTHGSPALSSTAAGASAVGDTAAVGVATTPARADHRHSRESFGAVSAQTSYGASSGNGSASTVPRSDHTHGTPALPTPGAIGADVAGAAAAALVTAEAYTDSAVAGRLAAAANLSDVADVPTARTNLGAVPTTRQVIAGTGLTGGGTLAADRTFTVSYGSSAGTAAQGNDSRITGALQSANNLSDLANAGTARTNLAVPPTSRLIAAGTGLTGGGDLTADRTLAVAYGTSAGTAAEGNDSRITGALQKSVATTKGDLLVATGSGVIVRRAVGSDGQVLTADSAQSDGVKWATPAGGASGMDAIFPLAGYGLLAASGVPEAFSQSGGIGDGQLYAIRTWIPAGVAITSLWVAVQTGGTYTSGAGNRLGLYDDTGAQVGLTPDDSTLWSAGGWRGGAVAGGPIAGQGSGRFVYILIGQVGFSGITIPYAVAGSGAPWFSAGVGVTKRRCLYTFAALPGSFDPTSYGTSSSFLPLVGVS